MILNSRGLLTSIVAQIHVFLIIYRMFGKFRGLSF